MTTDPHDSAATAVSTWLDLSDEVPLPSVWLRVDSLLVIGVSVLLASLAVRGVMTADALTMPLALISVLIPPVVGTLQYAACFRRSRRAAKSLFHFHTVGTIGFLGYGSLGFVALLESEPPGPELIAVISIPLLLAVLAGVSMWTVLRWSDRLEAAQLATPEMLFQKQRPFQVSIYELLLAMTAVAIVAGLGSSLMQVDF